jgi:hypothetical protein
VAFKTLTQLRTAVLNDELGLTADGDNTFGTTAQRDAWLQKAIAKLWPSMGRLTRETVTTLTNTMDYTLTTLYDIERVEIVDPAAPGLIGDRVRSWQVYVDEAADPPTIRLLLPAGLTAGLSLRCIGYAPYVIPASGAASCDIPTRLEWVVAAGARVEAFRWKLTLFANFERFQNENRQNSLTPADVVELLRQARSDFERGMTQNARNLTGARRAQLNTS